MGSGRQKFPAGGERNSMMTSSKRLWTSFFSCFFFFFCSRVTGVSMWGALTGLGSAAMAWSLWLICWRLTSKGAVTLTPNPNPVKRHFRLDGGWWRTDARLMREGEKEEKVGMEVKIKGDKKMARANKSHEVREDRCVGWEALVPLVAIVAVTYPARAVNDILYTY